MPAALDTRIARPRLQFLHADLVCFAMEQAGIPILRDLRVWNDGTEPLVDAQVGFQWLPELGDEQRLDLPALAPGAQYELARPNLRLEPGRLRKLIERERAQLRVRVYCQDQCLLEELRDVDVLAYNEWPGQRAPLGMLVSFVTPNQAALLPLQAAVKSWLLAETRSDAIDGYQSRSKERVLRFMRGAFECLGRSGVSYASLPPSFEEVGQKVRLVDTVLGERTANCLDASLLLASLLESFGLRPLVILLSGHALVAVWLLEDHFPEGVVEDAARLRTLLDLGHIVALETTLALGPRAGDNTFEHAVAAARERLASDASFVAALDVHVLRNDGFRPLSFRELGGRPLETLDLEATRRQLAQVIQAPDVGAPDAQGSDTARSPASRRFQKWKDSLLDLTLRNKLLHFRTNRRSALMLEVPDLARFEDLLVRDTTFVLLPRVASEADDPRSPELVAARNAPVAIKERRLKELASGHLHSPYPPEELESRAVFLERTAKTDLEEGGASTLYIAIGLLRWFESADSDEPKLTPLLLYPVALRFDRQKRRITVRKLEEDPVPNQTLIEKMRRDYKVDLSKLASLEADDAGVHVPNLLRVVREAIQQMPRWEVLEEAHLGHFTFSKFLMWKDLHENESDLLTSPIVQHIADPGLASPLAAPPEARPEELDDRIAPSELPCVLSADSTQMLAVHAALAGTGLVLQGPPGTGKSQTITNLIAAALARGQSVLFVSEKMAALEVVYRRLRDVGLEDFCLELHSHKTTRKQVVDSFARALQSPLPGDVLSEWTRSSEELTALKLRLNSYVRALHATTPLGKSVYEVLSRQLELTSVPELALPVRDPLGLTAARFAELRAAIDAFAQRARPVSPCAEHPWRWAGQREWSSALEEELAKTARAMPEALSDVDLAAAELARSLDADCPGPTALLMQLVDRSRAIERELESLCNELAAGPVPRSALSQPTWSQLRSDVHDYTTRLRAQTRVEAGLSARWREGFHAQDLAGLAARFARWVDAFSVLAWLTLWGARRRLKKLAKAQLPPNHQILEDLEAARARPVTQDGLRRSERALSSELSDVWSEAIDPEVLDTVVARGERARLARQRLQALPSGVSCGDEPAAWPRILQRLTQQRTRLESALARAAKAEQRFTELTMPAARPWADETATEHRVQLTAVAQRASEALDRFRDWCLYQREAESVAALGLRALAEAHAAGAVAAELLAPSWERAVLTRWCKAAIDAEPALRDFAEVSHERLVQDFGSHDSAHERLAREWIRGRLQERVPRAQTALKNSELDILRREIQKKARHSSIRKLIQQLPELRSRLKPCFLMSPLSVAQYLPAQSAFDVVVFDEASQIETHDAVGAIARGRQVVIVGDSKQLPPTRFFARGLDNDNDDTEGDDDDVVDLESILDEAKARSIPELTLGWHYRSRHDALIEFSNRRYYDDRLQVFPAARSHVADLGITWHPVPSGMFYSSASRVHTRTNPEEAKALVEQLVSSLLQHEPATRTFGVVTFSLSQKNLIEELLETARREHPAIERHWSASEAVFVKNLENVQGDERDEILFSIAYAKNEKGQINHHFGPVSNPGGERRLNVAITRARKQLRVFSTLTHDQIDLGRTRARGAEDLHAFLRFAAEHGERAKPRMVAPVFDSALERELYRTLTDAGYTVRTKIGCGAYRVDLAVEHPEQPGVYALGIECDGPMYHSARACRDRDRLRSEVLHGLSWRTYRVWSLAWHFGRAREVERLLAAVKEACEARLDAPETRRSGRVDDPTATSPQAATLQPAAAAAASTARAPAPAESSASPGAPSPGAPSQAGEPGRPYVAANLGRQNGEAGELYSSQASAPIRAALLALVDVEAPVLRTHAAKRIVGLWNMTKLTQKAEARVSEEISRLQQDGKLVVELDFLWSSTADARGHAGFRLRDSDGSARDPAQIAPIELANAMAYLLEQQGSLESETLVRETARLFGLERLGNKVSEAMRNGLSRLQERGQCRIEGARVHSVRSSAPKGRGNSDYPGAGTWPARPASSDAEHFAPLQPGRGALAFARYELIEELPGGAMAQCFRACDHETGDVVFLKRVRVGSAHEESLRRELDIYAKLMAARCENVLEVLRHERDAHYVALITEFADGGDLESHVRSQAAQRLSPAGAIVVACDIARGLVELHQRRIVHRDLKPGNVLRSGDRWKLADFGIAKDRGRATPGATFQQAGSYGYAPPEQWLGTEADPSADVYALGKLVAFMLTGATDPDAIRLDIRELRQLAFLCTAQPSSERPTSAHVLELLVGLRGR